MEPNLWHRGVHGGAAPPTHPWQARTGKSQKWDLFLSPLHLAVLKGQDVTGDAVWTPRSQVSGTLRSQVGDALLPRDPTGSLPIPGLCSCLGMDPSLPALCKGQGADTSDDLTISFYYFYFHFSMTICILLSSVFSSSKKDSFYIAG